MFEYIYTIIVRYGFWILSSPYYIALQAIISISLCLWLVIYRNRVHRFIHFLVTLIFILVNAFYFGLIISFLVGGIIMWISSFTTWPPYNISKWYMYGSFFIVYVLFLVGFVLNNRTLFTTKSSLFFAIRYLFQIIIFFSLFSPIFIYFIFIFGNTGGEHNGFPQVCLSAGESIGCKMYNKNGMENDVVTWCEDVYTVANKIDSTNIWKSSPNMWEDISIQTLNSQKNTNLDLKLNVDAWSTEYIPTVISDSSKFNTMGPYIKVETVKKGAIDAIKMCINPKYGGLLSSITVPDINENYPTENNEIVEYIKTKATVYCKSNCEVEVVQTVTKYWEVTFKQTVNKNFNCNTVIDDIFYYVSSVNTDLNIKYYPVYVVVKIKDSQKTVLTTSFGFDKASKFTKARWDGMNGVAFSNYVDVYSTDKNANKTITNLENKTYWHSVDNSCIP